MQKPVWMICATHMFVEVFYFTQVALIPVLTKEFHVSLLEVSLVATAPNLISLLANIPSGLLADRMSANRLLFASMTVEGLSILMVSQARDYWILVLALCFVSAARPLYHMSGLSQITRLCEPDQLNLAMGLHNALGDFGTAAGVASLAVFLSVSNWRWAYTFWAIPILIWGTTVLMTGQLKGTRLEAGYVENTKRLNTRFPILPLTFLIFAGVVGIRELGSTSVSTFMTTYLVRNVSLSESVASLIFGLGALVGVVGSLAGGYLGQKIGSKRALSSAILAGAISLSVLAFAYDFPALSLIYLTYAFFDYAVWGPMHAMIAEITPETTRGLSYSIYFFADGLMFSLAPILAAGVIELTNIKSIFLLGVIFLLASLTILQFLTKRSRTPIGTQTA